jgi:hypothetical protein
VARGRRRIRREAAQAGRPSIFFIAALTVGILFLLWFFIAELRHPVNETPRTHSSLTVFTV